MKGSSFGRCGFFLRAVLFSSLLLLPALVRYWQNGEFDIDFVHIDESVYLRLPFDAYELRSPESIYFEHGGKETTRSFLTRYPNAVVDYGAGWMAAAFHWGPVALGLFLDFFVGLISYVLVSLFFRGIFRIQLGAEVAAVILLAFPGLLIPSQYFDFSLPFWPALVPATYVDYSLPVHRGVYTQVSYLPFLWSLWLLASICLSANLPDRNRNVRWLLLGCSTALLLYCYIFAWASAMAIALQLLVLDSMRTRKLGAAAKTVLNRMLFFSLGHLLIGGMGLFLLRRQEMMDLVASPLFAEVWFFSPMLFFLACLAAYLLFRFRSAPATYFAVAVLFSCFVGETVLMNLQPLLRQSLTPYQIPTKYLHPLVSGIFTLMFLEFLSRQKFLRPMYFVYSSLIVLVFAATVSRTVYGTFLPVDSPSESKELIQAAPQLIPEGSVVAAMSVVDPFSTTLSPEFSVSKVPTFITSMLKRPVLHQDWISLKKISDTESIKRELAAGWLYSGKTQLLWPCVTEQPELPGDIFTLTWTDRLIKRAQYCESQKQVIATYSVCELLKDFRIDFLIWSTSFRFPKPDWYETLTETVWRSRSGLWELKQFKQAEAIQKFCE